MPARPLNPEGRPQPPRITFSIELGDEEATAAFAEDVAAILRAGDVVALAGDLGAGKTTVARAILRALADDPALEVPSPTFTLVQTYSGGRMPVSHFDLYRLSSPGELDELGFEEAVGEGVVLVEWPERAAERLPEAMLGIDLDIVGTGRRARVEASGDIGERLLRSRDVRTFLESAGWSRAARRHLQGDASTRIYERVHARGRRAVVMNWQMRPEGPPVRNGMSYDAVAHRTRDVRPFLAIDAALRAAGFSAPEIYAADVSAGFLLIEDFGSDGVIGPDATPDAERYRAAVEMLVAIHGAPRPDTVPGHSGGTYRLPRYDRDAMTIEAGLFADWYMPHVGAALDAGSRAAFDRIWDGLADALENAERSWVLRDVHSPNLLWLRGRTGVRRVGLIDFQDALYGPAAYDVASLLQDARVTVPANLESELKGHYVALRRAANPAFDAENFITAYAVCGAQRATKVLGIFTRLAVQSGRSAYLNHLQRVGEYLHRNLGHPVLSDYRLWYERHLPPQE